ncbi:MAG: hypothetical protein KKC84_01155 [Candidatus Omnitrophica bacterium]|nr:hypothetical protein [Candidatus Omnitrophota bacterium]
MKKRLEKVFSLVLTLSLLFQQVGFAQVAIDLNLAGYLPSSITSAAIERFRPLHMRYFAYDGAQFKLLLDKGDIKDIRTFEVKQESKELFEYFLTGITLPNECFWVNLRPDSSEQIIDPYLEQTNIGKVLLESDVQLKKDTAAFTSPQNPKGKLYWEKLYKKAYQIFGTDSISIPTLTRPWIVPNDVLIRYTADSAYVYKATLKVMLEADYLKNTRTPGHQSTSESTYSFEDVRMKELNEYSSQLIRELIIPELNKEVNTSKRYAQLRQVYFSLILAQWFKTHFRGSSGKYASLIDSKNLAELTSPEHWSKNTYFKYYQQSFKDGEYNIQTPVYTVAGQTIRSYFSGGITLTSSSPVGILGGNGAFEAALDKTGVGATIDPKGEITIAVPNQENKATSSPISKKEILVDLPGLRHTLRNYDHTKPGYIFSRSWSQDLSIQVFLSGPGMIDITILKGNRVGQQIFVEITPADGKTSTVKDAVIVDDGTAQIILEDGWSKVQGLKVYFITEDPSASSPVKTKAEDPNVVRFTNLNFSNTPWLQTTQTNPDKTVRITLTRNDEGTVILTGKTDPRHKGKKMVVTVFNNRGTPIRTTERIIPEGDLSVRSLPFEVTKWIPEEELNQIRSIKVEVLDIPKTAPSPVQLSFQDELVHARVVDSWTTGPFVETGVKAYKVFIIPAGRLKEKGGVVTLRFLSESGRIVDSSTVRIAPGKTQIETTRYLLRDLSPVSLTAGAVPTVSSPVEGRLLSQSPAASSPVETQARLSSKKVLKSLFHNGGEINPEVAKIIQGWTLRHLKAAYGIKDPDVQVAARVAVAIWLKGQSYLQGVKVRREQRAWLDNVVEDIERNFMAFRQGDIRPGWGDQNMPYGSLDLEALAGIGTPAATLVILQKGQTDDSLYSLKNYPENLGPAEIVPNALINARLLALPLILEDLKGKTIRINGQEEVLSPEKIENIIQTIQAGRVVKLTWAVDARQAWLDRENADLAQIIRIQEITLSEAASPQEEDANTSSLPIQLSFQDELVHARVMNSWIVPESVEKGVRAYAIQIVPQGELREKGGVAALIFKSALGDVLGRTTVNIPPRETTIETTINLLSEVSPVSLTAEAVPTASSPVYSVTMENIDFEGGTTVEGTNDDGSMRVKLKKLPDQSPDSKAYRYSIQVRLPVEQWRSETIPFRINASGPSGQAFGTRIRLKDGSYSDSEGPGWTKGWSSLYEFSTEDMDITSLTVRLETASSPLETQQSIERHQVLANLLDTKNNINPAAKQIVQGWKLGDLKSAFRESQERPKISLAGRMAVAIWLAGKKSTEATRIRRAQRKWFDTVVSVVARNFVAYREGDIKIGTGDAPMPYTSTDLTCLSIIGTPNAVLAMVEKVRSDPYLFGHNGAEILVVNPTLEKARLRAFPLILDDLIGSSIKINGQKEVLSREKAEAIIQAVEQDQANVVWERKFEHRGVYTRYPHLTIRIREIKMPELSAIVPPVSASQEENAATASSPVQDTDSSAATETQRRKIWEELKAAWEELTAAESALSRASRALARSDSFGSYTGETPMERFMKASGRSEAETRVTSAERKVELLEEQMSNICGKPIVTQLKQALEEVRNAERELLSISTALLRSDSLGSYAGETSIARSMRLGAFSEARDRVRRSKDELTHKLTVLNATSPAEGTASSPVPRTPEPIITIDNITLTARRSSADGLVRADIWLSPGSLRLQIHNRDTTLLGKRMQVQRVAPDGTIQPIGEITLSNQQGYTTKTFTSPLITIMEKIELIVLEPEATSLPVETNNPAHNLLRQRAATLERELERLRQEWMDVGAGFRAAPFGDVEQSRISLKYDLIGKQVRANDEELARIQAVLENAPTQTASSAMGPNTTGGIDLRYINMVTQAQLVKMQEQLALPALATLKGVNLAQEKSELQKLMGAGITPSSQRIIEYVSASYLRHRSEAEMAEAISFLIEYFKMEEMATVESTPEMKAFVSLIESEKLPI